MNKKDILLIGILPHPVNGQTLAFQSLINEMGVPYLTLSGKRSTHIIHVLLKVTVYLILLIRLIFKLLRKRRVVYLTLAQSSRGFMRDLPIIFMTKFLGSKIIVHIHGGNYDGFYFAQTHFVQKVIRKMLIQTNSIIVLSERMKQMFDFEPTLFPKIKVIPNGLAWRLEEPYIEDKVLNKQKPIRLLFLSNLIESKGYLEVLKVTEILKNRYGLEVKADFCGDFIHYQDAQYFNNVKQAKQYFFDYISTHNLSQNIDYHGVVNLDKKIKLLKQAHFLVLPTRYINEGQPLAIIEAMAYKCLVLATDFRGISEMIQHHETGVFVSSDSPEKIAQQILHFMSNTSDYQRITNQAFRYFQSNFTKEKHLQMLIGEIESHLNTPNAIDFHGKKVTQFAEKYHKSAQFIERFRVFTTIFDEYLQPKMKILDAGCGSGVFSQYLAKKECTVTGIDGSSEMIDYCKSTYGTNTPLLSFYQEVLPFKNVQNYANQDAIICSSVLEYITDYELVIEQFSLSLKPNGLLIVSMPNQDCWYRYMEKKAFMIFQKPAYYQYTQTIISEEVFTKRLKKYGFKLIETHFYPTTTIVLKGLKKLGIHPKYINTLFVGVYVLEK
ncbi:MAG: glycosyltransferase [Arcicella sp.]|jgi:glycosyltransferase involved in cell wall biosynthesis/trans-aconitate methyltransferase|nr:glycosyltransferase [Arcicella sp.]